MSQLTDPGNPCNRTSTSRDSPHASGLISGTSTGIPRRRRMRDVIPITIWKLSSRIPTLMMWVARAARKLPSELASAGRLMHPEYRSRGPPWRDPGEESRLRKLKVVCGPSLVAVVLAGCGGEAGTATPKMAGTSSSATSTSSSTPSTSGSTPGNSGSTPGTSGSPSGTRPTGTGKGARPPRPSRGRLLAALPRDLRNWPQPGRQCPR